MSVKGCIKHRRKDADGILDEKSIPVPETGCWLWTGQTNRSGYGVVWFDGRMWLAHRLSYITLFLESLTACMFVINVTRLRA